MNPLSLDIPPANTPPRTPRGDRAAPASPTPPTSPASWANFEADFQMALDKAAARAEHDTPRHEQAREAAVQLVATTLVQPLLKMARENPLNVGLFDAGPGQDAFKAQLDERYTDLVVRNADFPIVDALADHLLAGLDNRIATAQRVAHPIVDQPMPLAAPRLSRHA